MPAKVVRRSAIGAPSGGFRDGGGRAGAESGGDRQRGALAVLDRLDGEIAAAGATVAAGPETGDAGAAVGVGDDAATCERQAGAGEKGVVELLADRLHHHVGGEHALAGAG